MLTGKHNFRVFITSLVISCASWSIPCHAQDLKLQLQQCGQVSDNISRLQCFDNITKQPGLSTSSGTDVSGQQGSWSVDQSNNPLDDTKTIVLTNVATSGTSRMGDAVSMIVRCQSGQTDVYINWGDYLGDGDIDVSVRVGTKPVEQETWTTSTDHTSSFSPTPTDLIKKLVTTTTLVVQVIPYDENPIIATFDTAGLTQAISPVTQTCKWHL